MPESTISRDALYVLVCAKPMLRVAEQFAVSSSYMARVCQQLHVPRPERGYWAKLQAETPETATTARSTSWCSNQLVPWNCLKRTYRRQRRRAACFATHPTTGARRCRSGWEKKARHGTCRA
jgi:hypothetical protein